LCGTVFFCKQSAHLISYSASAESMKGSKKGFGKVPAGYKQGNRTKALQAKKYIIS
jgi:hypothetical protein